MDVDKTEIIDAPIENEGAEDTVVREGEVATATSKEVGQLYEDLGIKAPVPTGKAKGRPKATSVRDKDVSKKDDDDTKSSGQKEEDGGKVKSQDAPDNGEDGAEGSKADSKSSKVSDDERKVSKPSEKSGEGVRKDEPESGEDSEKRSEGDADEGAERPGQAADKSDDASEEDETDVEGKRPGKSNPAVEKRFQKLAEEKRERDERIAELETQLRETQQRQEQEKISQEDPEYKMEDFRKVRDEYDNIIDLDDDEAELAYRRWKDGYDQRASERQAKANKAAELERAHAEHVEKQIQQSAQAYDTLVEILDTYPSLNPQSPEFDRELSSMVTPVIEKMIIYQEGTEPGNPDGNRSVILGMSMNPKIMLDVINKIRSAKRAMPLNGTDDSVEPKSNVQVSHSRNTDPTAQAANELYRELGINKRI